MIYRICFLYGPQGLEVIAWSNSTWVKCHWWGGNILHTSSHLLIIQHCPLLLFFSSLFWSAHWNHLNTIFILVHTIYGTKHTWPSFFLVNLHLFHNIILWRILQTICHKTLSNPLHHLNIVSLAVLLAIVVCSSWDFEDVLYACVHIAITAFWRQHDPDLPTTFHFLIKYWLVLVTSSNIHKCNTQSKINIIKDGVLQDIVLEKQTIVHLSQILFIHPSPWATPTLLFWFIIVRIIHIVGLVFSLQIY